jgi:protein arginine kinase activator
MTCNVCGTNEATIHLTEIINNQMLEIHLCEVCAQEKGTEFKTYFNLGDLLAGFTEGEKPAKTGEKKILVRCAECGLTYDEFAKSGRLGCAACYSAFSKMLTPLIKRIHHAVSHLGKKPSKVSKEVRTNHDLRLLQDRLRKCIQGEEFEEAARVRDEIKQIEEKMKKGKNKNE